MDLTKKNNMNFIDLFAGAGGLSEGFIRAGFKPIAHVEMDKAACNTMITRAAYYYLKENGNFQAYLDYIQDKITRTELYKLLPQEEKDSIINKSIGGENNQIIFDRIDKLKGKKQIDVIIGGPPCQAYSIAGRSRDANRMKEDARNHLYIEYAKFLEYYKPKVFVFENVIGLKSAKNKDGQSYLKLMIDLFKKTGYHTEYKVLEAKDFGVLQKRKRIILIGKLNGNPGFYPTFKKIKFNVTVSELLNDLPKIQAGEGNYYRSNYRDYSGSYLYESKIRNGLDFTTLHISRPQNEQDKKIYKLVINKWNKEHQRLNYNDIPTELQTHKNTKTFGDRFKIVAGDLHESQTVVAHVSKDGHYYIHPDISQNRSLTPREVARIQTFPDDYFFEGVTERESKTAVYKQIGNAVPPLMAEKIAYAIKDILDND